MVSGSLLLYAADQRSIAAFASSAGPAAATAGDINIRAMKTTCAILAIFLSLSNRLRTNRADHFRTSARATEMSASLIGRLGSSAFRPSTTTVSMSLAGSCFSSESAPGPFHHGVRRRGGTIFTAALSSDERQVQADIRTHLIHRPARDIFPRLGGIRVFSYRIWLPASLMLLRPLGSTGTQCRQPKCDA